MGYEQIAAVDLGSNSFRLQIGRVVDDQIYPLDTLKESVRLASGLTADKQLAASAQQRALDALRRFGERLRGFDGDAVRAVATNTLRVAKNARAFIPLAEQALGFPIEVIAGREEARLIYIGAAHALPLTDQKRLVVDIGGGSTEFIIGRKHDPVVLESLFMGCVSYSLRFFPDGRVDRKRFAEAQVCAAREIQTIAREYQRVGWELAAASSGRRAPSPTCSRPTRSTRTAWPESPARDSRVCRRRWYARAPWTTSSSPDCAPTASRCCPAAWRSWPRSSPSSRSGT